MGKWIAVGLEGTLSRAEGHPEFVLGEPIQPMISRVHSWLRAGVEVRVLTELADDFMGGIQVRYWLDSHGLGDVGITSTLDKDMQQLWDNRAIRTLRNTGIGCATCLPQQYQYRPIPAGLSPLSLRRWLSQ